MILEKPPSFKVGALRDTLTCAAPCTNLMVQLTRATESHAPTCPCGSPYT